MLDTSIGLWPMSFRRVSCVLKRRCARLKLSGVLSMLPLAPTTLRTFTPEPCCIFLSRIQRCAQLLHFIFLPVDLLHIHVRRQRTRAGHANSVRRIDTRASAHDGVRHQPAACSRSFTAHANRVDIGTDRSCSRLNRDLETGLVHCAGCRSHQ
jgi:hypothetical protein